MVPLGPGSREERAEGAARLRTRKGTTAARVEWGHRGPVEPAVPRSAPGSGRITSRPRDSMARATERQGAAEAEEEAPAGPRGPNLAPVMEVAEAVAAGRRAPEPPEARAGAVRSRS